MTDGHNTLKESLKSKKIPLPEADWHSSCTIIHFHSHCTCNHSLVVLDVQNPMF